MYLYIETLNLSTLGDYDRACLVAKYNSNYKRETIDPKIFDRGYSEERLKYLRKTLGNTVNISCSIEFNKDFKDYPDYEHFNFIMFANHVFTKSGTLPFPGSLSEQPSQIMEIFETLFELDMEREEDARRKAVKDRSK